MLNPDAVPLRNPSLNSAALLNLEKQFDRAIRDASDRESWPATVFLNFGAETIAEITHVVEKYRGVGWRVEHSRHDRIDIDHPSRKR